MVRYQPNVKRGKQYLNLAKHNWDVALFRLLASLIPPGGHIMVWCEGQPHRTSYLALTKGVPPIVTPLGRLLWKAGFFKDRFFDLPEGGWEGEQKLWAEKPLDTTMGERWRLQTMEVL